MVIDGVVLDVSKAHLATEIDHVVSQLPAEAGAIGGSVEPPADRGSMCPVAPSEAHTRPSCTCSPRTRIFYSKFLMGTIKASKHCWPVYRTAARLGCIVAYHGTNIPQTRTPAAESQSWAESHDSYRVNILPAQDYDSHDQLTTLGRQGGKPATTDRPCRRRLSSGATEACCAAQRSASSNWAPPPFEQWAPPVHHPPLW